MNTLNNLFSTSSQVFVDSSFSARLYATNELLSTPSPPRPLSQDSDMRKLRHAAAESVLQIVLTNTVDMSRFKLELLGRADRCADLNRRAARVTRRALGVRASNALVGGVIGASNARRLYAELVNGFAEQAEALAAGGVDLLWLEGFTSPRELEAALSGCAIGAAELPIVATVAFCQQPALMTMLYLLHNESRVVALGLDGSNGLAQFVEQVGAIRSDKPLVIKGNLNALTTEMGRALSAESLWSRFAQICAGQGVSIIAGDESCRASDFRAMHSAVRRVQARKQPILAPRQAASSEIFP